MYSFDLELTKRRRWEITQIVGDDQTRAAVNCRGEHVPVIRVGQRKRGDKRLVTGDQAVWHVLVHHLTTPRQALGRQFRPVRQQIPRPFVVDLIRPACLEQIRERKPHEEITQRCRIEDTRVVEDNPCHGSIAHVQVLA